MKKTLKVAALSSVLVLGMVAGSYAAQETAQANVMSNGVKLTLDGSLRSRGMTQEISTVQSRNSALFLGDAGGAITASRQMGINAYNVARLNGMTDAQAKAEADKAIKNFTGNLGVNIYASVIYDQATGQNRTNNSYGAYQNAYDAAYTLYFTNTGADTTAAANVAAASAYAAQQALNTINTNAINGNGLSAAGGHQSTWVANYNANLNLYSNMPAIQKQLAKNNADWATMQAIDNAGLADTLAQLPAKATQAERDAVNARFNQTVAAATNAYNKVLNPAYAAAIAAVMAPVMDPASTTYDGGVAEATYNATLVNAVFPAGVPSTMTAAQAVDAAKTQATVDQKVDAWDAAANADQEDAASNSVSGDVLTAAQNARIGAMNGFLSANPQMAALLNSIRTNTSAANGVAAAGMDQQVYNAVLAHERATNYTNIYNQDLLDLVVDQFNNQGDLTAADWATYRADFATAQAAAATNANDAQINAYNNAITAGKTVAQANTAGTNAFNAVMAPAVSSAAEQAAAQASANTTITNRAIQAASAAAANVTAAAQSGGGFNSAKATAVAAYQVARANGATSAQAVAAARTAADAVTSVTTGARAGMYREDEMAKTDIYDQRARLGVKAEIADVTGYLQIESGAGTADSPVWGTASATGLNVGGQKDGTLDILQAWINYKPGSYGVQVGHMPLALGNKVFFDHTKYGDDAVMAYAMPTAESMVAGLLIKFDEQNTWDASDDLDGYVLLGTYKASDTLDFGANWTFLKGSTTGNALTGNYDVATGFAAGSLTRSLVPGMEMSNIGLNANYKAGPLSIMGDVEMQFGTVMDINGYKAIDASGFAVKLSGNYDLGPAKLGLLYGYGSGQDETSNDADMDSFVTFLSNDAYETLIVGYRAMTPGTFGATREVYANQTGRNNTGLSNLSLYQLNASAKTVCPLTGKDLSLFSSLSYIHLNEDHIVGFEMDGNGVISNVTGDSVGTELDLVASWALNSALTYKVEAAYLWSGDAWDTAIVDRHDADNMYYLRHGLEMKF